MIVNAPPSGWRWLGVGLLILLCFTAWLLVAAALWLVGPGMGGKASALNWLLALASAIVLMPWGIARGVVHLRRLCTGRLPTLRIDKIGVTDSALGLGTIPWTEIVEVKRERAAFWSYGIYVVLAEAAPWKRKLVWHDRFRSIFSNEIQLSSTGPIYCRVPDSYLMWLVRLVCPNNIAVELTPGFDPWDCDIRYRSATEVATALRHEKGDNAAIFAAERAQQATASNESARWQAVAAALNRRAA